MKLMIETVRGCEGNSLSIGNIDEKGMSSGYRIAGPKPWGGVTIIDGFEICPSEIISILREINYVYPEQLKDAIKELSV